MGRIVSTAGLNDINCTMIGLTEEDETSEVDIIMDINKERVIGGDFIYY